MNIFHSTQKLSLETSIFGVMVLIIAALLTMVHNFFIRMELSFVALVFLNLFFYSLLQDKLRELERKIEEMKEYVQDC